MRQLTRQSSRNRSIVSLRIMIYYDWTKDCVRLWRNFSLLLIQQASNKRREKLYTMMQPAHQEDEKNFADDNNGRNALKRKKRQTLLASVCVAVCNDAFTSCQHTHTRVWYFFLREGNCVRESFSVWCSEAVVKQEQLLLFFSLSLFSFHQSNPVSYFLFLTLWVSYLAYHELYDASRAHVDSTHSPCFHRLFFRFYPGLLMPVYT